ncbi:MAG: methyltransferase domain-containing protein [Actinobacteria bacterium]|nr:methyltransferase domain-containing protein [Actinomycetota bacterium]
MDSSGWDRRYGGSELVWSAEPNRFLAAEAGGLAVGRALDLACGEGRNAVWLAQQGWEVTGVDFSQVGLDKARRLAEQRAVSVQWLLADLVDYLPPPAAFDFVAILYLHIAGGAMRDVLRRATAALAPDGTLLVVGHDPTNIQEGYGGPQDPAILLAPDEIAEALAGLEIERAERVRRPVPSAGEDVYAIDALVRAVRPR